MSGILDAMASTVFDRRPADPALVAASLADSRLSVFWLDELPAREPLPRLANRRIHTDLVVVGGGYTGLWTALRAKERDPQRRVVLVEGKRIGWAASGRNGGFVEASLTHGEKNGESRYPDELEALTRLGMENLDAIQATVEQRGWQCDFERVGSFAVATELYQLAELVDAHDGETEHFFDAHDMRQQINSPTYEGGLLSTRDTALTHPGKLARALLDACLEAGVEVFESSPVLGLHAESDAVELRLRDGGVVRANRVALATNAFPSLLKRYRLHTVPVYDYVLMTEPLTDAQLASIGWHGRQGVADTANQFHYYRLSADNRILWGGYDAIYHYGGRITAEYDERPASYEKLASHFFTTFPQLEGVRFTHRWAGVIDTSSRFFAFHATAHGGRVAYSAGFTGLGVAATRFAADVMLDQLAGLETERTSLRAIRDIPMPFPPEPATYPAVQSVRWALDRADHNHGRRNLFLRTLDAVGLGFDS
ncbi:glycine/D-amino acid oxidase-like deaminating enzyme [Microcella putealis]|uniref:Glycine/D-amino acid oxidase-like deaminating enzyme n=2 Tax=Microcella putealis TaxID=337005 RepID=A0A4Q7LY72_9MICO|nr:glycine/D-amino acid oxidase-like deaminating enzyme [Microcella putealis]TQM19997.1 glycine/D-amino acid oxidase-like deaminating enzyme [Microcella putealis]